MNNQIKVLIADDHSLLATGLQMVLSQWDEFKIVGIASNGKEVCDLANNQSIDLIIMDLKMPEMSGVEAITRIKEKHPNIKILALTTFDDSETVKNAMGAGCDGFLLKTIEPETLKHSLLSIINDINVYDEEVMDKYRNAEEKKSFIELSDREKVLLKLICEGKTNLEIANEIGLQVGTVKNLVSLLLSKTNCISRSKLAAYVIENNII